MIRLAGLAPVAFRKCLGIAVDRDVMVVFIPDVQKLSGPQFLLCMPLWCVFVYKDMTLAKVPKSCSISAAMSACSCTSLPMQCYFFPYDE